LLTLLQIDEPVLDPAEKAELEKEIQIKPIERIRDDEDDDDTTLLLETNDKLEELPCVIIKPCKVPLQIRGENGIEKTVFGYIDSGAPASFCSPETVQDLMNVTTHEATKEYWGAIRGIPKALAEIYMKPPEADGYKKMYIYVARDWSQAHKQAFGDIIARLFKAP